MRMKRRQLFEFQDLPWFPDLLREAQMEILSRADRTSGFARAIAPALGRALDLVAADEILDLCSGGGGPILPILAEFAALGRTPPRVSLSDLYPRVAMWSRLKERAGGRLDFVAESVDATRLPPDPAGGVTTIINALHHFPPERVRAIIAAVARRGSTLFVAEAFGRSLRRASVYWPSLTLAAIVNPFVCKRRGWLKAALTWLMPVVTLSGVWDWFASAMREFEPAELAAFAQEAAPQYRWEFGHVNYGWWGRAGYLIGAPPGR